MKLPIGPQYSNLGPILPRFRAIRAFACRQPHFFAPHRAPPLFRREFWGVPFGIDPLCLDLLPRERTPPVYDTIEEINVDSKAEYTA